MKNLILIGMPGVGKSTVGVVLAKKMGYRFLDSDLIIQEQTGKVLHQLIDAYGIEGFWELENKVNLSIDAEKTIIATGGSAIYGAAAMERFCDRDIIIYLKLSYEELKGRLGDLAKRGVTMHEGQTLKDLYDERIPLYEKYAKITISCDKKQIRDIVDEIEKEVCNETDEME